MEREARMICLLIQLIVASFCPSVHGLTDMQLKLSYSRATIV